jgi:hypothetical protein
MQRGVGGAAGACRTAAWSILRRGRAAESAAAAGCCHAFSSRTSGGKGGSRGGRRTGPVSGPAGAGMGIKGRGRGKGAFQQFIDTHRRAIDQGSPGEDTGRRKQRSGPAPPSGKRRGGGGGPAKYMNDDDDDLAAARSRNLLEMDLADLQPRPGWASQFEDAEEEAEPYSFAAELADAMERAKAEKDPDWEQGDKEFHELAYHYHKNPIVRLTTTGPRGKYEPPSRRARSLEELLHAQQLPEGLAVKEKDPEFEQISLMWSALSQNPSMTAAMKRSQIRQITSFIAKHRDSDALAKAMTVPPEPAPRKKAGTSNSKSKANVSR